jgi:hypothetical protein
MAADVATFRPGFSGDVERRQHAIDARIREVTMSASVESPVQAAIDAARMYDTAQRMVQFQCATCSGECDESTVEGALKRAAADTHGQAITPEIEAAFAA